MAWLFGKPSTRAAERKSTGWLDLDSGVEAREQRFGDGVALVLLRAWQAPSGGLSQQQAGLVSFQLELGLDVGLRETVAQVAVLLEHCGEIRPRGAQRGLGLLSVDTGRCSAILSFFGGWRWSALMVVTTALFGVSAAPAVVIRGMAWVSCSLVSVARWVLIFPQGDVQ